MYTVDKWDSTACTHSTHTQKNTTMQTLTTPTPDAAHYIL